jgi:hypothetical protein
MTVRERSGRWAPWLGVGPAGLAIAEMLTAAVLSVVVGWSWRDALEAFVVTRCESQGKSLGHWAGAPD